MNIVRMETCEAQRTTGKASGGIDGVDGEVRDAKGVMYSVKAEPTPAASSRPLSERVPPSVGESKEPERNVDRSAGNKVRIDAASNLLSFDDK